jgi:hypothetical protein
LSYQDQWMDGRSKLPYQLKPVLNFGCT